MDYRKIDKAVDADCCGKQNDKADPQRALNLIITGMDKTNSRKQDDEQRRGNQG